MVDDVEYTYVDEIKNRKAHDIFDEEKIADEIADNIVDNRFKERVNDSRYAYSNNMITW